MPCLWLLLSQERAERARDCHGGSGRRARIKDDRRPALWTLVKYRLISFIITGFSSLCCIGQMVVLYPHALCSTVPAYTSLINHRSLLLGLSILYASVNRVCCFSEVSKLCFITPGIPSSYRPLFTWHFFHIRFCGHRRGTKAACVFIT